jgi:hypothetical protein
MPRNITVEAPILCFQNIDVDFPNFLIFVPDIQHANVFMGLIPTFVGVWKININLSLSAVAWLCPLEGRLDP